MSATKTVCGIYLKFGSKPVFRRKSGQWQSYFIQARKLKFTLISYTFFCSIWIELCTWDAHKNLLIDGEFRENRRSENLYFT